jgi:transglutaminase-like putative cysteine protease
MKAHLYDITHTTVFEYQSPISVSHHLMRMSPRRLKRQLRFDHRLSIDPPASTSSQRTDYFGNDTTFATIAGLHRRLCISSYSRVGVSPAFIPEPSETPHWESVRGICHGDRSSSVLESIEFMYASPVIPIDAVFAKYAAESFRPKRSIMDAALELNSRVHLDFKFDASATTVSTPLMEVFEQRRGVCQDFAHFQIACFRSLGLPARYVSGYLETIPPPGQIRLVGADMTHAWMSFFCPGIGWIDLDPTNNCMPSLRHITVAWGRDYADVSPIRGVVLGSGAHTLSVAVDVVSQGTTQMLADQAE